MLPNTHLLLQHAQTPNELKQKQQTDILFNIVGLFITNVGSQRLSTLIYLDDTELNLTRLNPLRHKGLWSVTGAM